MISFLLLILGVFVPLFLVVLSVKLGCLFDVFLVEVDCIAISFPPRTAFTASHRFWVDFLVIQTVNLPAMQNTRIKFLGWEEYLEK